MHSLHTSIHFLRCWQGEFVQWSTALQLVIILTTILVILLIDSGVILLRKILMLVTLRGQRIGHQFSSLHQVLKSNNVLIHLRKSWNLEIFIHLDVYLYPIHWPAPSWLVSSIGRALHQYRRGHGFKSRTGLNFFRSYLQLLVSVVFLAARIS